MMISGGLRRKFRWSGFMTLALVVLLTGLEASSFQETTSITGGGTTNFIPKFVGNGTEVQDSVINEVDGRVGIGVETPFFDLEVNGSVLLGSFEGLFVDIGGQVGIGTTSPDPTSLLDVRGDATFDGIVTATTGFNGSCNTNASEAVICNQDLAEAYFSSEQTEPGDLLVLTTDQTATVSRSSQSYDPLLVGVVSTNPGLVFDHGQTSLAGDNSNKITADKTIVALTGRVPVKVVVDNGPIQIGDPITSSARSGWGMKATQPGKIIGYALENIEADGMVLAMIQPGYFQGEAGLQPYLDTIARQDEALKKLRADYEALQSQWMNVMQRLEALETDGRNENLNNDQ